MDLAEAKLGRVSAIYPILGFALALKLLNTMGISQGDDLYYTQLAYRASQGDFSTEIVFGARWFVYLPSALIPAGDQSNNEIQDNHWWKQNRGARRPGNPTPSARQSAAPWWLRG